jgi:hypothetical protein
MPRGKKSPSVPSVQRGPERVFSVRREVEFKVNGALVAHYVPGLTYRVTDLNSDFVKGLGKDAVFLDTTPQVGGRE